MRSRGNLSFKESFILFDWKLVGKIRVRRNKSITFYRILFTKFPSYESRHNARDDTKTRPKCNECNECETRLQTRLSSRLQTSILSHLNFKQEPRFEFKRESRLVSTSNESRLISTSNESRLYFKRVSSHLYFKRVSSLL